MSADLFAEFNDLSKSPSPSHQQPSSFPPPSNIGQTSKPAADPFDFFNSSNVRPVTSQPTPQWQSLSSQATISSINWNSTPIQQQASTAAADDEDGWGDFEVAEPSPAPPSYSAGPSSIAWQAQAPSPAPAAPREPEPRTRIIRASTIDLMTNNLVDVQHRSGAQSESFSARSQPPKSTPNSRTTPSDPNVLFDADDFELQGGDIEEEDEDDFGDFETVASPPQHVKSAPVVPDLVPSLDILTLSDTPQPLPTPARKQAPAHLLDTLDFGSTSSQYPQAPKSPSYRDRNPFPELAIKTPTAPEAAKGNALKSASPVTAWPSVDDKAAAQKATDDDDDWGAWDEYDGATKNAVIAAPEPADNWDWDAADSAKSAAAAPDDDVAPPVNVPPPSVILSAFPDLLNSGNSLFKPISGQTTTIKQRVLENPKALEFLQGYILIAATAARVIAGRKHRWHRDKILAKSMSISAAGSKGMKLAGVDKTQSAREDREAADIAAVWREHVGRLRSAVAVANAAGKANLKVPELGESLSVQTAKNVPTASKPCVICGLKRDERVTKVDYDIEDSFGEWWVDHWGHRVCKSFWIEHEQNLRQR